MTEKEVDELCRQPETKELLWDKMLENEGLFPKKGFEFSVVLEENCKNIVIENLELNKAHNFNVEIEFNDNSFQEDIKEVDFNKIPLLDKDSSIKLGDRTRSEHMRKMAEKYIQQM